MGGVLYCLNSSHYFIASEIRAVVQRTTLMNARGTNIYKYKHLILQQSLTFYDSLSDSTPDKYGYPASDAAKLPIGQIVVCFLACASNQTHSNSHFCIPMQYFLYGRVSHRSASLVQNDIHIGQVCFARRGCSKTQFYRRKSMTLTTSINNHTLV